MVKNIEGSVTVVLDGGGSCLLSYRFGIPNTKYNSLGRKFYISHHNKGILLEI